MKTDPSVRDYQTVVTALVNRREDLEVLRTQFSTKHHQRELERVQNLLTDLSNGTVRLVR